MYRHLFLLVLIGIFVMIAVFSFPSTSAAEIMRAPQAASSAYDLIEAVNALRASNGLSPYNISSILMYTAQSQADFMATNGIVTHSGPAGVNVTDRLLAAGYPLAGDLSLGGFRSENIISGSKDMPAEDAVSQWTGDAPHLTTMLSPNLTEIGAGVAIAGGRVYYVIDAAHPVAGGAPLALTPVVGGGSGVPGHDAPSAMVISTPNVDGDVIHDVLLGQTLWQIAVSYDVKIEDIKRLNNLFDNTIHPGEKLLIRKVMITPAETPTGVPTLTATPPPSAAASPAPTAVKSASTSVPAVAPERVAANEMIMGVAIGIIALALLGGGMFTWFGSAKKRND